MITTTINTDLPATKFFQKLVVKVDEKFVRFDGFADDPLNMVRKINITKLTGDLLEAKDFNKYPAELNYTLAALPTAKILSYSIQFSYTAQERKPV